MSPRSVGLYALPSGVTSQSNRDNNKTKNRVCPAAPSPAGLPLPPRSDRGRDGAGNVGVGVSWGAAPAPERARAARRAHQGGGPH
jgi:hypothetical protein